jgi:hypothetical protein
MRQYVLRAEYKRNNDNPGVCLRKFVCCLTNSIPALLVLGLLSPGVSQAGQIPLAAALAIVNVASAELENSPTLVESVPEPEPAPPQRHRKIENSRSDREDTPGRAAWCRFRGSGKPVPLAEEFGSVVAGLFTLSIPTPKKIYSKRSSLRCLTTVLKARNGTSIDNTKPKVMRSVSVNVVSRKVRIATSEK